MENFYCNYENKKINGREVYNYNMVKNSWGGQPNLREKSIEKIKTSLYVDTA